MGRTRGLGARRAAVGSGILLCALVMTTLASSCASTNANGAGADSPGPEDVTATAAQTAGFAPGMPGLEAKRATSQAEMGEALRELGNVGNACDLACPQLIRLRMGVKHMCGVSQITDDLRRCKEAKETLLTTETGLKPSCGTCAPHHDTTDDADADINERPL